MGSARKKVDYLACEKENELVNRIEFLIQKLKSINKDEPIKVVHDEELITLIREYLRMKNKTSKQRGI